MRYWNSIKMNKRKCMQKVWHTGTAGLSISLEKLVQLTVKHSLANTLYCASSYCAVHHLVVSYQYFVHIPNLPSPSQLTYVVCSDAQPWPVFFQSGGFELATYADSKVWIPNNALKNGPFCQSQTQVSLVKLALFMFQHKWLQQSNKQLQHSHDK